MEIAELLAPLFLLILAGAVLHRVGLLPVEIIGGINRLLYWVGLPAVVFHSLAIADDVGGTMGPLLAVLVIATCASVGLAWSWSALLRIAPAGRGTFVQAAFRGNLSFIGLPLLLTVPGVPTGPAVMAMAPMLIIYNAVAVASLLASQHRSNASMWSTIGRQIVRNPIIASSVAGAAWHYAGWSLPKWAERSLASLAEMALPLALLCIGAALLTVPLRGNHRIATVAALHKTVVSPAIGYGIGRLLGLDAPSLLAALLCLACPTAAVSYTMVKQLGGDEAVAASTVVLSALLAVPVLAVILAWFAV
ncbi:MAG TPA: AEC family transporter [Candidatus Synoicihabitans sp.]|nr:AEC family transporter [Candidatus Synoicihabitans sp.]